MTKSSRNQFIATAVFIVLAVAMFIISRNEAASEWLTRHIYFNWAKIMGPIFAYVEFDVFEVSAFVLCAALLTLLIFAIYYFVHKNSDRGVSLIASICLIISIFTSLYVSTVSIMYNREKLDVYEVEDVLDQDEVLDISVRYFLDFYAVANEQQLTEYGATICPYTDDELIKKIQQEYDRQITSDYYCSYTATPKKVASSYLMTAFSIAGITFGTTVEPGYNYQMPMHNKCITIAHELAHTKGVMREDDANELAYYVLLNAQDSYLKYVGYLYTCNYVNNALALANIGYRFRLPGCAQIDKFISSEFWSKKAYLSNLGDAVNSLYLKTNSQSGTSSYTSYSDFTKEVVVNEEGQEEEVYVVVSFSHVQNMIFGIYQ